MAKPILGGGYGRELNRQVAFTELIFQWGERNNKQGQ